MKRSIFRNQDPILTMIYMLFGIYREIGVVVHSFFLAEYVRSLL